MPWLEVLHGGLSTTVQDAGRPGYLAQGLAPAGAVDGFMLACANMLVGNPPEAAALEVTLDGPVLRVVGDTVMALAAVEADWYAGETGWPLPTWEAVLVRDGAVVTVGAVRRGVRAYLAVAGGIDVPPVLGSRSTHVRAGVGGLDGRPLAGGDRLPVGRTEGDVARWAGRSVPERLRPHRRSGPIRVMAGPQADAFSRRGLRDFFFGRFRVSARADRMGVRLEGPPIRARGGYDIVSEATAPGSVQVTGDGQPLVLLAERPTTGGYPKIATVITADLDVMGQLRPGQWVRFLEVGEAEARRALAERQRRLEAVRAHLEARPPGRPWVVVTAAGVYRVE